MHALQEIIDLTTRLIEVPSIADRPAELKRVIDLIAGELDGLPGIRLHRIEEAGFPALAVTFGERTAAQIILNAHVDVVPGREEQFVAQVRDGRIYGRGAQDMKAAAAVYIRLIKDLAAGGQSPDIAFQFVTDEEIGGDHGTRALLERGFTGELFIAGEPTDLQICNRAKGILWLVVHQPGRPAHGSRPWEGSNPIIAIEEGLARLLERYPVPGEAVWRTTVTPSAIAGGDAQNRVPVRCDLKLDIRYVPEEGAEAVLRQVRTAFKGADVELIHQGSALQTDESHPLVQRIAEAQEAITGQRPRFYAEHFGSDARFYGERGMPAVCWGPIGAGLHSDEEWVEIESLQLYYTALRHLVGIR
ncbi:MAG: peptidase M20 [Herpetosiphonaceae bacterium]|nr:MAG: peptidase M20 [Herpetosiphonaceae bacterium]